MQQFTAAAGIHTSPWRPELECFLGCCHCLVHVSLHTSQPVSQAIGQLAICLICVSLHRSQPVNQSVNQPMPFQRQPQNSQPINQSINHCFLHVSLHEVNQSTSYISQPRPSLYLSMSVCTGVNQSTSYISQPRLSLLYNLSMSVCTGVNQSTNYII